MSQGFRELDNNSFEQATAAFNRAGKVYANHPAVEQALAQLETRRSQLWVTRNMARADQSLPNRSSGSRQNLSMKNSCWPMQP